MKPAEAPRPAPLKWTDETLKQEAYATPPKELVDAVLAPRYRNVALTNASPDKKWFLDEIGDGPVAMAVFSKPFHELGGLFVDFQANRARPLTIRNNAGIQIISAADGSKKPIQIPAGARVSNAAWSPDGSLIAFYVHTPDATHIWVADPDDGRLEAAHAEARARHARRRASTSAPTARRSPRSSSRTAARRCPRPPAAPAGPQVKVADDADKNRLRTFPSLMSTPYDFQLLEWHATGQVVVIDVTAPAAPPAKGRAPKNAAAGRHEEDRPAADGPRRSTSRPTASTSA